MEYEKLTEYAGWFLATPLSFQRHIAADHYIKWNKAVKQFDCVEATPHYKLPGAFDQFTFDFMFDYPTRSYQQELDELSIELPPDQEVLSSIDVSNFSAKQVFALLYRLIYNNDHDRLLYEAAASSLLDRCLYKLKDIDLMSHPPGFYDYKPYERTDWHEHLNRNSWESYDEDNLPKWVWCVVGNIIDKHPFGPDGRIVRGTKHFSPGTKVYCMPRSFDDRLMVIGKPRGRRGLIKVVISEKLVENYRCQKVHSPAVLRKMYTPSRNGLNSRPWGPGDDDHEYATNIVHYLNQTDEDFLRERIVRGFTTFELHSEVDGISTSIVEIRIVRRMRSDGSLGSACFGSYRLGNGAECSIGLIDWFGYWPEGKTYEESKSSYHEQNGFLDGLCQIGLDRWKEEYAFDGFGIHPKYTWELSIVSSEGSIQSRGANCYPADLPSLYRYLHAFGFPRVWDAGAKAPLGP